MGRYIFTHKDLAPFLMFLDYPVALAALAATIPVKRLDHPEMHVEKSQVQLAGDVQSHRTPDGVPLHKLLSAVQEQAPDVRGLVVRNGNVVVTHAKPPTEDVRNKIDKVLSDPELFSRLKLRATTEQAADAGSLVKKLTDPATPDEDWIKAFRQYAVRFLIKEES